MKIKDLHPWDISPNEAIQIQKRLRDSLILKDDFGSIRLIAGCDLALETSKDEGYGGIIVYSWPDLKKVERKVTTRKITFPYIPGLLAFREAPVLLDTIAALENEPDLFFFDGQGIAHPRGLGIASHMGLLLDRPTIGCAKSKLYGSYEEPGSEAGSDAPLIGRGGETVGSVVRTRDSVQPIFVSQGHRISLTTAVRMVLQCTDGLRVPKPTREADRFVETAKRESLPAAETGKRDAAPSQPTLPFME